MDPREKLGRNDFFLFQTSFALVFRAHVCVDH
jgi:hypothetical protein